MSHSGYLNRPRAVLGLPLVWLWLVLATDFPHVTLMAQQTDRDQRFRFGRSEKVGRMASLLIGESSGLAPSALYPGRYWTHNDNQRNPGLFLIEVSGKLLATVSIPGAEFLDWEAIATVRRDGRNLIVIGDVGDNFARRDNCRLFLMEEPGIPGLDEAAEPLNVNLDQFETIHFQYPDGPQDCEAMGIEATGQRIWLVSKQRPGGARARNGGGRNGNLTATTFHYLDWPGEIDERPLTANRVNTPFEKLMVTGMDFSPDGRLAVIRTYFSAHLFCKNDDQTWQQRLGELPDLDSALPLQRQGEAIAFALDGGEVVLTSEGAGEPVWRMPIHHPAGQK